jgi:hypothetical protein
MTFPKDITAKLGISLEELSGASLVVELQKVVTGNGNVIEGSELDRLLKR